MQPNDEIKSANDFLADLDKRIREDNDLDRAVAKILADKLLTETPAEDCVDRVVEDLTKLAQQRADPKVPDA